MSLPVAARPAAVRRHLREEFGADGDALEGLVLALVQNLDELRAAMEISCKKQEWTELRRHGHSVRGIAANVGQVDLASVGGELESAAIRGDAAAVLAVLARLDGMLQELGCRPADARAPR